VLLKLKSKSGKSINGVCIDIITYNELLDIIDAAIHCKETKIIDYLNANTVVLCEKNKTLASFLNKCDVVHVDGIGVHWALKFLFGQKAVTERINGTDLYTKLLSRLDAQKSRMFLFGDTEIVLASAVNKILNNYPNISISGVHHGFVNENDTSPAEMIEKSYADIVLVGLGSPLQEEWVEQHNEVFDGKVCLIVGGGISFISGIRSRAPLLFRWIGIEWIFRLLQEPHRLWRRYFIGIPSFIFIILKQKLFK
jgi:exopolysaccharide biosynthesis WecB/TagA/CpsF family protein